MPWQTEVLLPVWTGAKSVTVPMEAPPVIPPGSSVLLAVGSEGASPAVAGPCPEARRGIRPGRIQLRTPRIGTVVRRAHLHHKWTTSNKLCFAKMLRSRPFYVSTLLSFRRRNSATAFVPSCDKIVGEGRVSVYN